MRHLIIMRLTLLLPALLLVACEEEEKKPVVDVTPIGDAIRFLAIAAVLAVIINAVLDHWDMS